jgi:hypothetical protein
MNSYPMSDTATSQLKDRARRFLCQLPTHCHPTDPLPEWNADEVFPRLVETSGEFYKVEDLLEDLQSPLTILAVFAGPGDEEEFDLEKERKVFRELEHVARVEYLDDPSEAKFRRRLRSVRPQVVHFSGHSDSDSLCFVGKDGRTELVDTMRVMGYLEEAKNTTVCRSSSSTAASLFRPDSAAHHLLNLEVWSQ